MSCGGRSLGDGCETTRASCADVYWDFGDGWQAVIEWTLTRVGDVAVAKIGRENPLAGENGLCSIPVAMVGVWM